MAAVLHPRPAPRPDLRLVGQPIGRPGGAAPVRPELRVVNGGRSEVARQRRRTFLLRRLVVASLLTLGIAGLAMVVTNGAVGSSGAPVAIAERSHVVAPGDTLWGIAAAAVPDADPRDTVEAIVATNDLGGGDVALRVGQRIVVPTAL